MEFIDERENDRMGLVVFSGESFTQCPLTTDHAVLKNLLKDIKSGMIEDGTAIGMGLATSVSRLKDSKAKSKIIILLTDGVNNRGEIDPITAAQLCHTLGIKVYTVGVGKRGMVKYPVDDPVFGRRFVTRESEIDEATLTQIATITGGKYYRATDAEALSRIYKEISELETTPVQVDQTIRYEDLYTWPLCLGLLLLVADFALGATWLRTQP